jgi:hypothetical protein
LEVKFATRLDSPACIDLFNKSIEIKGDYLKVEAMCRNDKKLLHYILEINLYAHVSPLEPVDDISDLLKKEAVYNKNL